MLAALGGGCLAPIAAFGRVADGRLSLAGRVLRFDGTEMIEAAWTGDPDEALELGTRGAEVLLAQGAADLIRAARQTR
jgi:hydroxymethylbilane synthase